MSNRAAGSRRTTAATVDRAEKVIRSAPDCCPKAKRIEFRCPDRSADPYLVFSAMLLAGIDGIRNEIESQEKDSAGGGCSRR